MPLVSARVLTPVVEVTTSRNLCSILLMAPPERILALQTYRAPPVHNHGSEKRFLCTHVVVSKEHLAPNQYCLPTVTEDPIGCLDLHEELALRYQLNPYRFHYLQPRRKASITVSESSHLREVFVEFVPLQSTNACTELWATDAMQGTCGINLYTRAHGVFSSPTAIVSVDDWKSSCKGSGIVLIYSSIPGAQRGLYKPFDRGVNSPLLSLDEAFISWDTLGWVSLNELQDMGALHATLSNGDIFDLEYVG